MERAKTDNLKAILDISLLANIPVSAIAKNTNKTEQEIWNYIDSSFRNEYPEYYKENLQYFCWGENIEESKKKVR